MLLVGFFAWWYSGGWRNQVANIAGTLKRVANWFSIALLLKTLFAPFHQISADEQGKDIASEFRAWGNRMFSRMIGAIVRIFTIIAGGIVLLFMLIVSLFRLILWPIFPLLPIAGVILMIYVGAPWKLI